MKRKASSVEAQDAHRLLEYEERSRLKRLDAERIAMELAEARNSPEPDPFDDSSSLNISLPFQRKADGKCRGWAVLKTGASTK